MAGSILVDPTWEDELTIYKNRQWVVTESGINPDASLPDYDIAIERVFELTTRGGEKLYDWPVHMASKTWVDPNLFNDAFEKALRHQAAASGEVVDENMLQASYAEALRIARMR